MTRPHLRLLTSHRLEVLADALARRLDERPLGPLERETIVVPSRGMARWVNFHLARTHGIAAGVDFPFPFTWARRAVEALGVVPAPEEAHEPRPPDGFDAASLQWRLHDLLGRLDALDAPADHLHPLRTYLRDDSDLRKRGQLAARLATIFSGYQLQRPLGLRAWEQGRWFGAEADRAGGETWQAPLWRALVGESRGEPLSRALLGAIEGLRAGTIEAESVGPRVEVFGVTTLAPVLLALLEELGKKIEVSLSFVSPTRGYWGDLRARRVPLPPPGLRAADLDPPLPEDAHVIGGPPLLASWGRLARDFHHAVVGLPDAPEVEELAAADPDASTLLGALQQDLLDFVDPSTRSEQERPRFRADDRSLRVHLCHSELREMEVVREEILRAFEDLPHLRPGDVLVLVPDLARYAPFARAVLGRTLELDAGERRLPVRIADGGGALTEGCGRLVLELLRLVDARLTATEVLDLFEIALFARRFDLGPQDLPQLRELVREAGVRWGEDPATRAERFALPAYEGASWREGLDRLLLGFATGAGEELIDGLLPVADATTARVGRIARLTRAFDRLVAVLHGLRDPRTLAQWAHDLRGALLDLSVAETEREVEERTRLVRTLESLATIGTHFGLHGEVGRRTVRDALRALIEDDAAGRGFVSGSITVAELRPMRSVPYRVIAVAGLGDAFPRRDPPPGFDLVARSPRRGDRSPRLDDRQLLLEILLAVRERLVITAIGRSVRDNTELARSVCLDELLEVLDQSFACEDTTRPSERVVVRHPLQPFDALYFDGRDGELFSYDRLVAQATAALAAARAHGTRTTRWIDVEMPPAPGGDACVRIELEELARFFRDPSTWFVRERLRMRTRWDEEELDEEPFDLDPLAAWRLRRDQLERFLRSMPPEDTRAAVQRLALARGNFGRTLAAVRVQETLRVLRQQRLEPERWIDLDLVVRTREYEVVGTLRVHPDHGYLAVTGGSLDARLQARTWVEHLALGASGRAGEQWTTRLISLKDAATEVWSGSGHGLPALDALDALVRGFLAAHLRPMPFFPETSAQWWKQWSADHPGLAPLEATPEQWQETFHTESVRAAWDQPSFAGNQPEAEKEAVKLCTRGLDPELLVSEEFVRWAELVFGGIAAARPDQKRGPKSKGSA